MISHHQIKAARALLDWSQSYLAESVDISPPTLRNIEAGGNAKQDTLRTIKLLFETNGLEFLDNDGVTLRIKDTTCNLHCTIGAPTV